MNFSHYLSFLTLTFLMSSLAQGGAGKNFSLMSYNVENLFDTVHDKGKNDWTYLPLAFKNKSPEVQKYCRTIGIPHFKMACFKKDWNKKVLSKKIRNIAKVMKSFNKGQTADIIVLQEVENMRVLKMLRDQGLKDQGLNTLVLIEGGDRRGIDTAIMSRFPLIEEPSLHITEIKITKSNGVKMKKSSGRGILEAAFDVYGKEVMVLANHWPSQRSPDSYRDQIARTMRKIVSQNAHRVIIAAGDFNTLPSDRPNGIENWVLGQHLDHPFSDPLNYINHQLVKDGTYWYKGSWNFLDRIFVWNDPSDEVDGSRDADNPRDSLVPIWRSLEVLAHSWMLEDIKKYNKASGKVIIHKGVPRRFNDVKKDGYSDHLPMVMNFTFKD